MKPHRTKTASLAGKIDTLVSCATICRAIALDLARESS